MFKVVVPFISALAFVVAPANGQGLPEPGTPFPPGCYMVPDACFPPSVFSADRCQCVVPSGGTIIFDEGNSKATFIPDDPMVKGFIIDYDKKLVTPLDPSDLGVSLEKEKRIPIPKPPPIPKPKPPGPDWPKPIPPSPKVPDPCKPPLCWRF